MMNSILESIYLGLKVIAVFLWVASSIGIGLLAAEDTQESNGDPSYWLIFFSWLLGPTSIFWALNFIYLRLIDRL
ncbi:hypothetical protein [Gloeothece verrucosa]|uniref:Uncharacterized protein n=1 Tax=Gloeothece verrucosa (strain PCC 7822) TaxID=497965 RepID=E0UMJ7_GLOV7|nr:hypothetical protein [Gloeothece verrucosa]ADN18177.1 hypothetical protein Cyan7822_6390 [Gloeothece verrucosa PCC 7822]